MKLPAVALVLCVLVGCTDRSGIGDPAPQPERWSPPKTAIDCGAPASPPAWSAVVDDSSNVARVPLDQWIGLATWIATVQDWQSCMASTR